MNVALSTLLPDQTLPAAVAARCVSGLALDSRRVRQGDAFIAVPGESVDGRQFIDAAVQAGASVVIAEAAHFSVSESSGAVVVGVPALHARVGEIAAHFYGEPAQFLEVLAVTGTNGKTSTTWFLRDALQAIGRSCALVGTLGMQYAEATIDTGHTTPDPVTLHAGLSQFRGAGAQAVAMEASSHALVQQRLAGVPVSVAVFTNLSRDHLDYHGDMERYFAAKALLFARPELSVAVLNAADEYAARLVAPLDARGVRVVTFGTEDASVVCEQCNAHDAGMQLVLRIADQRIECNVPVYGYFNAQNLMAVAGVLHGMDVAPAQIAGALAQVTPVPGRMQPVPGKGPRVLVDYAHTPDALDKSLRAVREHFAGKIWCVFGCGGNRDAGKRPQMAAVAEQLADHLVLTSDNPRFEEPQSILADMLAGLRNQDAADIQIDRRKAIALAISGAGDEDVVLIAGKGHERWQEIRGEKIPQDDVELARDALAQRGAA